MMETPEKEKQARVHFIRIVPPHADKWNTESGIRLGADREITFQTVRKIIRDQLIREKGTESRMTVTCSLLDDDKKGGDVYMIERIGSDSSFGFVYRLGFRVDPGVQAALKMMPRYEAKDRNILEENRAEIRMARTASRSMEKPEVQKITTMSYFPTVLSSGWCPTAVLPIPREVETMEDQSPDSQGYVQSIEAGPIFMHANQIEIYDSAIRYAFVKTVIGKLKVEYRSDPKGADLIAEAEHLFKPRNGWSVQRMAEYYEQHKTIDGPQRHQFFAQVDTLITEIAWGDMTKYLDEQAIEGSPPRPEAELDALVGHVFKAIDIMHRFVGIHHRDMHLANILITFVRDASDHLVPWPLITDFGRSVEMSPVDPESQAQDVFRFLEAFEKRGNKDNFPEPKEEADPKRVRNPLPERLDDRIETLIERFEKAKDLTSAMAVEWWSDKTWTDEISQRVPVVSTEGTRDPFDVL